MISIKFAVFTVNVFFYLFTVIFYFTIDNFCLSCYNTSMEIFENTVKQKIINYPQKSKEFCISEIGIHDFKYVVPLKAPRKQPYYTLHYVLSGKGFLELNGKKYLVKENEFFTYPPNIDLSYYPDENEPWTYFWFNFNGILAETYYSELLGDSPVLSNCSKMENYKIFADFLSAFATRPPKYYETLALFYSIMGKLTAQKEEFGAKNAFYETAKETIDLNYTQTTFSIESLCLILHISHSYLCKIFKEKTGITLKYYLTSLRLNHSLALLKATDLSIKQIAYQSGFSDEFNFMKSFKKHFGTTPSLYRKNFQTE